MWCVFTAWRRRVTVLSAGTPLPIYSNQQVDLDPFSVVSGAILNSVARIHQFGRKQFIDLKTF